MNKKLVAFASTAIFLAILVAPVLAVPTQGQKKAVTMSWIPDGEEYTESITHGNTIHNKVDVNWTIIIAIDGGPTYTGKAIAARSSLIVPQKDGANIIIREAFTISIDGEEGGFEGSSLIIIEGYDPVTYTWEKSKAHGLLQGTGVFEGQTINAGHKWVPFGAPFDWYGHILKA